MKNKKTNEQTIIIVCILLFSQFGFTQNSAIQLMPNMTQGYVVLSKANQPQVKRLEVSIVERKYNEQGQVVADYTIATKNIEQGKNYLKIEPKFLKKVSGRQWLN